MGMWFFTTIFESNREDQARWVGFARKVGAVGGYAQLVGTLGTCREGVENDPEEGRAMLQAMVSQAGDWPFRVSGVPLCFSGESSLLSCEAPVLPFDEWIWVFTGRKSRGYAPACKGAWLGGCTGLERNMDGTLRWESEVEAFLEETVLFESVPVDAVGEPCWISSAGAFAFLCNFRFGWEGTSLFSGDRRGRRHGGLDG